MAEPLYSVFLVSYSQVATVATQDIVLQNDEGDGFILAVLGFAFGLYAIYSGVKKYRKYRVVNNTATEKVRSVAVGRTELEGTARKDEKLLDQPFKDEKCLYYKYEIEEYDKDPGDDTRNWDTVESGVEAVQFYLEDETGKVLVEPRPDPRFEILDRPVIRYFLNNPFTRRLLADTPTWELSDEHTYEWTVSANSRPSEEIAEFTSSGGLSESLDNKRRYSMEVLPPDTEVYVFGAAEPRDLTDSDGLSNNEERLEMTEDEGTGLFLISDMQEDELAKHYKWRAPLYAVGGLALTAVCLYFILTIGA